MYFYVQAVSFVVVIYCICLCCDVKSFLCLFHVCTFEFCCVSIMEYFDVADRVGQFTQIYWVFDKCSFVTIYRIKCRKYVLYYEMLARKIICMCLLTT